MNKLKEIKMNKLPYLKVYRSYDDFKANPQSLNGCSEEWLAEYDLDIDDIEKYLINCTGCFDCHNCDDCTDCKECYECENCTDCNNLEGCEDCKECSFCFVCESCSNCDSCEFSVYCKNCKNCEHIASRLDYKDNKPAQDV